MLLSSGSTVPGAAMETCPISSDCSTTLLSLDNIEIKLLVTKVSALTEEVGRLREQNRDAERRLDKLQGSLTDCREQLAKTREQLAETADDLIDTKERFKREQILRMEEHNEVVDAYQKYHQMIRDACTNPCHHTNRPACHHVGPHHPVASKSDAALAGACQIYQCECCSHSIRHSRKRKRCSVDDGLCTECYI